MSKNNGASIVRRVARRTAPSQNSANRSVDVSAIKYICLTGAESLLKAEEDFLSTLSQINTLVLSTLLQSTDRHHELPGKEYSKVLKVLNEKFHKVWDLTAECFQTLKRNCDLLTVDLQDIYLLTEESQFIQVYTEYFAAVTSYMVIKGFEKSAKQTSNHWKGNTDHLMKLIKDNAETPIHLLLQKVFTEPLRQHIRQYSFQVSKLNTNLMQNSGVAPLSRTLEAFVNLQSHISQCLDEASQTRHLCTTLSKKTNHRSVSSRPPTTRRQPQCPGVCELQPI